MSFTLDTTKLSGNLVLGLLDPKAEGAGFSLLSLTVMVGATLYVNKTFHSLSGAESYFTDNAVSLGPVGSASGLVVMVSLDVTVNAAGEGFADDFLLGSAPPCFLPGTMIEGPAGEVAMEDLHIGDLVVAVDAGVRSLKPVRWIGRKTVSPLVVLAEPLRAAPVRIKAGALGEAVPAPRPAGLAVPRAPDRRRAGPGRRDGQRNLDRPRDPDRHRLRLLPCRTRRPLADPGRRRARRRPSSTTPTAWPSTTGTSTNGSTPRATPWTKRPIPAPPRPGRSRRPSVCIWQPGRQRRPRRSRLLPDRRARARPEENAWRRPGEGINDNIERKPKRLEEDCAGPDHSQRDHRRWHRRRAVHGRHRHRRRPHRRGGRGHRPGPARDRRRAA